jgi:hypothetical protein
MKLEKDCTYITTLPLEGTNCFAEISRLPQGGKGLFSSNPLRGEDLGGGDLIMFCHQSSW